MSANKIPLKENGKPDWVKCSNQTIIILRKMLSEYKLDKINGELEYEKEMEQIK
jgi:hypothetical protein